MNLTDELYEVINKEPHQDDDMYVCMYVCMYACMHVCMYACVHLADELYGIINKEPRLLARQTQRGKDHLMGVWLVCVWVIRRRSKIMRVCHL